MACSTDATEVLSGDTIRLKVSFRDYAIPPAVGALVDPDDNEAIWTLYDIDENELSTGTGTRESLGVYYSDWTAPASDEDVSYWFEFKGLFNEKPQLKRVKLTVRFGSVS